MNDTNQISPPVALVQTWCLLSRDKDKDKDKDEEVSQHAMQMLLNTFVDMKAVVDFVKTNKIRIQ